LKILFVYLLFVSLIIAQTGGIQGKISSEGLPLPGVNILVLGTSIGGISDDEGFFRIRGIPAGEIEARFSNVGYETRVFNVTVVSGKLTEINVEMKEQAIEFGEVRVIDKLLQEQDDPRPSLIELKPAEARRLPGAVTDVFRTLQSLPGVLAPNDFSSQLIIRGSGPDQNLIIMDDVEIFNPYRLYGVISMFNPEAVSDISLITGGFPVNYGDRLSAVLDVTNRQGDAGVLIKGNLNASIVAANLLLEGKNPFGIPGSWLINSRRTYYDLIIEPFVKKTGLVEDNVSFPNFTDVQTKIAFGPFNGHKFFFNAVLSRDAVQVISGKDRQTPDSVGISDLSKNDLASFSWHFAPSKKTLNKFVASWYRNGGDTNFESEFLDPSLNREDFSDALKDTLSPYLLGFGFKSNYSFSKYSIDDKFLHFWGKGNSFEAGIGVDFMETVFDFDVELSPELEAVFRANPRARSAISDLRDVKYYNRYRTYLSNKFAIGEKLFLQPGIRYDYYNLLGKGYFAPRVSLSYLFDNLTTLRAVWGRYYQSPGYEKLRDANIFFDLADKYTAPLEAENSTHYVLSLERWLTAEWKLKGETYYKHFDDLIVPFVAEGTKYYTEPVPGKDPRHVNGWTRPIPEPADSVTQIPVNNSNGEAYGIEIMLEKRNIIGEGKISGWVSYALAFANRYEDGLKIPFRYDQRHTINLVLDYKINNWIDLGFRFQYGSGFPYREAQGIKPRITLQDTDGDLIPETPVVATRRSVNDPEIEEVIYDVDYGENRNIYNAVKPDYHRLDVRINFYRSFWGFDWTFYLDVINVYNHTNVSNYNYYITKDLKLGREINGMFPILPTIGFNARF